MERTSWIDATARQRLYCALILLFAQVFGAAAERVEIELASGETVKGEIKSETDTVLTIVLADGSTVEVVVADIAKIERSAIPEGEATPAATGKLELVIPEQQKFDCTYCQGQKSRACKVCEATGKLVLSDDSVIACSGCKGKGKVKCEVCKGKGDMPDLFKSMPCPGCSSKIEAALAPGFIFCPLCVGSGLMKVANEPKGRKCALCDGKGGLTCTICAGEAILDRLWLPGSKRDAEAWLKRCDHGLAAIERVRARLSQESVTPQDLNGVADEVPQFAVAAKVLASHLHIALNMTKRNLEGTEDFAAYLSAVAAAAAHRLLSWEAGLLTEEKGYVIQR